MLTPGKSFFGILDMQFFNNYNQIFLFSGMLRSINGKQFLAWLFLQLKIIWLELGLKLMMFTNVFAASDKPKEIMLADRYN